VRGARGRGMTAEAAEAGPVALVTGSSSGIGAAVARRLAGRGYRVVVNSVRSVEAGQKIAAELPAATYVQADIADTGAATALVQSTVDTYGRLDVLVNNAGTTRFIPHRDVAAVTPEVWQHILGVNVIGTWQTTLAALPALRATGAGCVVNITSLAGCRQLGSSIPYAVSKAAVNHMTRLLANVVGPEVRVNAVAPGLIDTPWTANYTGQREAVEAGSPLRRVGVPDDVATTVVGLIDSRYVTGQVLVVDGGTGLNS
jgi:ketoreductase RED2